MGRIETFITNFDDLESTLQKIIKKDPPLVLDREFFTNIGVAASEGSLYVKLFYELELIDKKGIPLENFRKFNSSGMNSRIVLAQRLREGYRYMWEVDDQIYDRSKEAVLKAFQTFYGKERSPTYIRLVAYTFFALAQYANWDKTATETIDDPLPVLEYDENTSRDQGHHEFLNELVQAADSHDYWPMSPERGYGYTAYIEPGDIEFPDFKLKTGSNFESKNKYAMDISNQNKTEFSRTLYSEKRENEKVDYLGKALLKRASLLQKLDRYEEVIPALDQIVTYFDINKGEEQLNKVAGALILKATILERLNKNEEALSVYSMFIERFDRQGRI